MKKLCLIVLSLSLLIMSTSVSALAVDITEAGTNDVEITYNAADNGGVNAATWEVTVPATIEAGKAEDVSVKGNWAPYDILTVSTDSEMTLYYDGLDTADYATVPINFTSISLKGDYENAITATGSIVVDENNTLSAIKFGTWQGILVFNISFDTDATYKSGRINNVVVSTVEELTIALENAGLDDYIELKSGTYELTESITTDGTISVGSNEDVTIILTGQSIVTDADTPAIINSGKMRIEGGSVTNLNKGSQSPAVTNFGGELTISDCDLTNSANTGNAKYCVMVTGGHVTLENGTTVSSSRGGIGISGDGYVTMNGGSVTVTGAATAYYPLSIGGTGNSSFVGVTFNQKNSSKTRAIVYSTFVEDSGTATFTDCAFSSTKEIPMAFEKNYTGLIINDGCTYSNVTGPEATA